MIAPGGATGRSASYAVEAIEADNADRRALSADVVASGGAIAGALYTEWGGEDRFGRLVPRLRGGGSFGNALPDGKQFGFDRLAVFRTNAQKNFLAG